MSQATYMYKIEALEWAFGYGPNNGRHTNQIINYLYMPYDWPGYASLGMYSVQAMADWTEDNYDISPNNPTYDKTFFADLVWGEG